MINLAYKKRLIKENVLNYADNMKTKQKEDFVGAGESGTVLFFRFLGDLVNLISDT